MTFDKLKTIIERELGTSKLSDIAKELSVSPQVVSNWKSRNQVPYKYVRQLRKKINKKNPKKFIGGPTGYINISDQISSGALNNEDGNPLVVFEDLFFKTYDKIIQERFIFFSLPILLLVWASINLKFFETPIYTSRAKILPISDGSSVNNIAGLASEFGLNFGSTQSTGLSESKMVPNLIKSRRMARNLLNNTFTTQKMGQNKKLIAIILSDTLTQNFSEKQVFGAINKLSRMISINGGGPGEPLIHLFVVSEEPRLSAQIADSLIKNLGKLMNEYKLERVIEKKSFIETRLLEVNTKLVNAEEKLRDFRQQNRSVYSSPSLMLEQSRLVRDLEMFTTMHLTLVTQSEMIKIEEVGKTDMLQVLDHPEVPIRKTSPIAKIYILARVLAGFCMSIVFIFLKTWMKKNKYKILDPLKK